jgi:hypothetical protein
MAQRNGWTVAVIEQRRKRNIRERPNFFGTIRNEARCSRSQALYVSAETIELGRELLIRRGWLDSRLAAGSMKAELASQAGGQVISKRRNKARWPQYLAASRDLSLPSIRIFPAESQICHFQ